MPDFPYIDFQGHKRYLSCLPSDPKAMAANPNWKSEKSTIAKSDIIDWIKKNGGHYDLGEMILSPILDQDGIGACASFSATSCFNLTWNLMNQTQHVFSPFFQYAQVNGGVDQGSSPVDNMNSLMKTGICLDADNPKRGYFPRNIPQTCYEAAKRYKVSKAYTITGADDLLTAVMLNRPVGFGMSLPSSFQQINQATGMPTPGGFLGLHGMLIRGLYYHPKLNDLVPVVQNSWTQSFGIQDATRFGWQDSNALKGCCFIPLGMIITPQYFEAWCCESNYLDPEQKIPIAA